MTEQEDPQAPDHFYKFRQVRQKPDFDRLERILLNNEIFFPRPAALNDPFECRPVFDYDATKRVARDECYRLINKFEPHLPRSARRAEGRRMAKEPMRGLHNDAGQLAMEAMYYKVLNEFGVFCASAVNNDVLMWSHYADSHLGICLEFNADGPLLNQAQHVKYAPERPIIRHFVRANPVDTVERALLTKSQQWDYEQEWRVYRTEGFGPVSFEPENLTGIIYGALTPLFVIDSIKSVLARRSQGVKESRAVIDRKTFTIKVEPM